MLDWHRGRLSSRRLTILIKHLPRDSAVNRDLHGEVMDWGPAEHLLAAAVDHLAVANWMTGTLNTDEDADPLDYPEPVPRPGADGGSDEDPFEPVGSVARDGGPGPLQLAEFFT
ncbi:hypothetical protein [Streptomyces huiliensis]|uniref:hypothetical protein n=1 Tax=Streptomyces huiliensis TaxID=2876027 RepID=UPI001CBCAF3E|nr:hypothetical protein [Streptomyces huiliensis]